MASSVEAANASTTRAQFSSTRDPDDEKNRRQLIGLPGAAGVGSRARPLEPLQQTHSQHLIDPQLPASCRGLGPRTCDIPVQGFWKVSLPPKQPARSDPRLQISAASTAQKTGIISDSLTQSQWTSPTSHRTWTSSRTNSTRHRKPCARCWATLGTSRPSCHSWTRRSSMFWCLTQ